MPDSLSSLDVGELVHVPDRPGLWKVVCIRDGRTVEVTAHPWAASWAAPRSYDVSALVLEEERK